MKQRPYIAILFSFICYSSFAQTNVFPSSGNVGIGTTSPAYPLDVNGMIRSGSGSSPVSYLASSNNAKYYTGFRIYNDIQSDYRSLEIDYSGSNYPGSLVIGGIAGEAACVGTTGSYPLMLYTNNTYAMGITGAGNILIGTNIDNGNKLQINGTLYTNGPSVFNGNINLNASSAPAATITNTTTSSNLILGVSQSNSNFFTNINPGDAVIRFTAGKSLRVGDDRYNGSNSPYFTINGSGNVGIGTTNPQSALAVKGTITAQQVTVTQTGWSDFVLKKDYPLTPLPEVEKYIRQYHHLPNVPSTKEVESKGLNLGDMEQKQMQKIEELTLYAIGQDKRINEQDKKLASQQQTIRGQEERLQQQQKQIRELEARMNALESKLEK